MLDFFRAAVPMHGSKMRRGVRAPLALHDEAERGELAGAVADDLALLLLIPARAPVELVLQRIDEGCAVFLLKFRLLCSCLERAQTKTLQHMNSMLCLHKERYQAAVSVPAAASSESA